MNQKLLLTTFLGLIVSVTGYAQAIFQNTMYQYSQFAYNPAAAGVTRLGLQDGANVTLLGRLQWAGFEGAPETSVLTFDSPLPGDIGAAGLMVAVDRLGFWSSTYVQAAYNYGIELGNSGMTLRIGASGGIKQISLNPDQWVFPDEGDVVIPIVGQSLVVPMFNSGIHLSDSNFFVSLAGQNLLEPDIDGLTGGVDLNNERGADPRTFTFAAGYNFSLSPRMGLQPSVMLLSDLRGIPQINASLMWTYSPLVVGLNYRLISDQARGESIGAMLGVTLNSRTFIGYSYDYPLTGLNFGGDINTHEIILSYTFGDLFGGSRNGSIDEGFKRDDF